MTRRTFIITGDDEGPFHADGTAFCLGMGPVRPSEGHRLVVLGEGGQPGDIHYDDLWLNKPTCIEVPDEPDISERVTDPIWAVRGLWTSLLALTKNEDIRTLIQTKGSQSMLDNLDTILAYTQELATYDPPVIQEEAS